MVEPTEDVQNHETCWCYKRSSRSYRIPVGDHSGISQRSIAFRGSQSHRQLCGCCLCRWWRRLVLLSSEPWCLNLFGVLCLGPTVWELDHFATFPWKHLFGFNVYNFWQNWALRLCRHYFPPRWPWPWHSWVSNSKHSWKSWKWSFVPKASAINRPVLFCWKNMFPPAETENIRPRSFTTTWSICPAATAYGCSWTHFWWRAKLIGVWARCRGSFAGHPEQQGRAAACILFSLQPYVALRCPRPKPLPLTKTAVASHFGKKVIHGVAGMEHGRCWTSMPFISFFGCSVPVWATKSAGKQVDHLAPAPLKPQWSERSFVGLNSTQSIQTWPTLSGSFWICKSNRTGTTIKMRGFGAWRPPIRLWMKATIGSWPGRLR